MQVRSTMIIALVAAAMSIPAATSAGGESRLAGLWDKPNEACMRHCRTFVRSGCFKEMAEKYPASNAASLQERCDDKFSTCLYQCMCENCKNAENKKDN